MDMLDLVAWMGLEWLYDSVEDRYGRAVAWLIIASALVLLGVVAWILIRVLRH